MLPTSIPDAAGNEKSGLDMYFLEQDGGTFKATVSRDRRPSRGFRNQMLREQLLRRRDDVVFFSPGFPSLCFEFLRPGVCAARRYAVCVVVEQC